MVKVLLLTPPSERKAEMHDSPDHPHIGLGYLASYLLSKNIEVEIIDSKLEKIGISELIRKTLKINPDIIGITAFTHDIMIAVKVADILKTKNKKIKIIIGGVHATALPKETLDNFKCLDYLVYGEGEITLYELVEALKDNRDVAGINGLAYRKKDQTIVNPPRERIDDLDSLPLPAWQLFPKCKHYQIMSSRGCPYNCVFCMSPYGRKKVRDRSPENVIKELDWVVNTYKPSNYTFNDETFAFNLKRANKLLDMMVEKGYYKTTKFDASLRANHVNFELLKKMKKAGFVAIDYGVETGNKDILKIIKKGVTLEQTENAIKITKKAGIKAYANFIIGHPFETKKTAMDTINYAVKLNAYKNAFGIMVPYPGTEVAEMAKKGECGYKLISSNWGDYNKQIGKALELKTLSRKDMEKLQLWGYLKVYLWNLRFDDLFKFILENKNAAIGFIKNYFRKK